MYQAAGEVLFTSGRPPTGRRYLIHLSGETLVSKTTSFQRLGTAGLAALAVVGLLSGCASKKKTAAASSTGSTSSAASPAATSAAAAAAASVTAAGPSPSKVVATGGGKFCQQVAQSVNNTALRDAATGSGVDSLKTSVQAFHTLEGAVLKSAPGTLKPDLVTLFGALDQFYGALAKANYDFSKIDPSTETVLETPAVKAATDRVDAYIKNTCGIDTGAGNTADDSAAAASASAALASALAKLTASPAG